MAAKITKGIVNIGRPTKLGNLYVLVEPMGDTAKAYVHISTSRDVIAARSESGKRLALRRRKV